MRWRVEVHHGHVLEVAGLLRKDHSHLWTHRRIRECIWKLPRLLPATRSLLHLTPIPRPAPPQKLVGTFANLAKCLGCPP